MNYNFKRLGENVRIFEPVAIMKPEMISIGNHVILSEFAYINGGTGLYIGNHVHIAAHSSISGGGLCVMEDFTGLSAGVRLVTGSAKFNGEGLTSPTLPVEFQAVTRSYCIIRRHATLATNVIVHPGVIIGEGTIIGSGSIVTKDTEPWSIYMGTPARKVKDRDPHKILETEEEVYKKMNLQRSDFTEVINSILLSRNK
jgi:acetyltransferase-like isoleucine patch superfamily enzyme